MRHLPFPLDLGGGGLGSKRIRESAQMMPLHRTPTFPSNSPTSVTRDKHEGAASFLWNHPGYSTQPVGSPSGHPKVRLELATVRLTVSILNRILAAGLCLGRALLESIIMRLLPPTRDALFHHHLRASSRGRNLRPRRCSSTRNTRDMHTASANQEATACTSPCTWCI